VINAKLEDATAIGPHVVNVSKAGSNERSGVKESSAMAQTLHLLDFPPLNFQKLNVIDTPS